MSFTRSVTNTEVHQNMPDYPTNEGYTTAQLKSAFDAPATGLQEDINRLETELEAATAAASLGADEMFEGDTSDANIQAKLEKLYADLIAAELGNIPDNTITKAKLVSSFSNTIPTNENMGVLYLASKYRTPTISALSPTSYTIPQLSEESHTGYSATMVQGQGGTTGSATSAYQMFNRSGSYYVNANGYIIINLPDYMRVTSFSLSGIRVSGAISGSNDNTNYTQLATYSITASDKTGTSGTVTNTGYYKYIKITFNRTSSQNRGSLYDNIVITGQKITSLNTNTMAIAATEANEKLSAYQTGQIVKISTPSNYIASTTISATLNIYGLGAKTVPSDLSPSTRYSLVYDGSKFVHE